VAVIVCYSNGLLGREWMLFKGTGKKTRWESEWVLFKRTGNEGSMRERVDMMKTDEKERDRAICGIGSGLLTLLKEIMN
jgi:hypothetical protein